MNRTGRPLLLALLAGSSALLAEEAPRAYSSVAVGTLSELSSRAWGPEHQFLQADRAGRVFLLGKDSLELYQISPSGKLLPKGRLIEADAFSPRRPVTAAAMSPAGDSWVLLSFPNLVHVFRGEHVVTLEAPWIVSAVAADGGEPLVAVAPGEMNTTAPTVLRLDQPPLLQRWDGKRWNTLSEGRFSGDPPEGVSLGEQLRVASSMFLILTQERHLWLADEHAYRLRRFSPSGALKDELSLGDGKISWSERTEKEWTEAQDAAKEGGLAWSRRWLSPVRAETVVRAISAGRDGAVYLLVQTKEGLALDRFQPALLTLERVLLGGIELGPGHLTMAAGKQGLYIAPLNAGRGIWLLDAETLDIADWHSVPDAVFNGQPLIPPKARETAHGESSDVKPSERPR